jgi:cytochrome c oxidase cbb3-type subunit 4
VKLSDIMSHAGLSIYAEVALIIFLVAFVGIVWWVFRPSARNRWEADARLPLDELPKKPSRPTAGGSHE